MQSLLQFTRRSLLGIAGVACLLGFQEQLVHAPTAQSILDGHIKAIGGSEALAKIKTRVSHGTLLTSSMDDHSVLTIWETNSSDRLQRTQSEVLGDHLEGSAKKLAWTYSLMGGSRILKGEDKQRSLREAPLDSAAHWKRQFESVEYLGIETIDELELHVVQLNSKIGKPEKRYYAVASGLHRRTEATRTIDGSPVEAVLSIGDYRPVDGVLVAHLRHTVYADFDEETIKLKRVVHNTKLPGDRFTPPAEVLGILEQE